MRRNGPPPVHNLIRIVRLRNADCNINSVVLLTKDRHVVLGCDWVSHLHLQIIDVPLSRFLPI